MIYCVFFASVPLHKGTTQVSKQTPFVLFLGLGEPAFALDDRMFYALRDAVSAEYFGDVQFVVLVAFTRTPYSISLHLYNSIIEASYSLDPR